jgi:hypothetical protein
MIDSKDSPVVDGGAKKNVDLRYSPSPVPLVFVFALSVSQAAAFWALGFALSRLFGADVIPRHLVFTSMYVCEVLALITHWLGHRRSAFAPLRWWYEAHTVGHHLQDYPPSKFLTKGYEAAKQDNSFGYVGALFVTPFLVAPWRVPSLLVSWSVAYLMLIVADIVHMALHVRGHSWERFAWFRHLRSLHYWHHSGDMKRNYAIGDFFLDFVLLGFRNK